MDCWDCSIRGVFLCHLHASLSLSHPCISVSPLNYYHLMSMTLVRCTTNITFAGRRGILARGKPRAIWCSFAAVPASSPPPTFFFQDCTSTIQPSQIFFFKCQPFLPAANQRASQRTRPVSFQLEQLNP